MKNSSLKGRLKVIHECDHPEILVVTPLRPSDNVPPDLRNSILRNKTPFDWVSYASKGNCPYNAQQGLEKWKKIKSDKFKSLKYIIKLDNDLTVCENFLDILYSEKSNEENIGYYYPSLYYRGIRNLDFPAVPFNPSRLYQSNYITSMAMIKLEILDFVGGFIFNKKYQRLCDWALWVHMLNNNFFGKPVSKAWIIAPLTEKSISSGSQEEYIRAYNNVLKDFIKC